MKSKITELRKVLNASTGKLLEIILQNIVNVQDKKKKKMIVLGLLKRRKEISNSS